MMQELLKICYMLCLILIIHLVNILILSCPSRKINTIKIRVFFALLTIRTEEMVKKGCKICE